MCKKPIKIINRSKYISKNGQPYYIWVNCGHCNECREAKQREWNLRTYYQTIETLKKGGYCYFDTLTYNENSLPRLSKFIESKMNYPCFNRQHIREFYEGLRQRLKLKKDSNCKYLITSEYGDIRKRPHYHIMLFITEEVKAERISTAVSESWKYGRTDGMPYKNYNYIANHNIIKEINLDCIRYIAKYITKAQSFTQIIDKRWARLEKWYRFKEYDKIKIKQLKRRYYNACSPFHRQSQHFGESALNYFSEEEILNTNEIYYKDDSLKINQYIKLPMYYKRKIYQQQIKYNGKRMWINTEKGIQYKNIQEGKIIESIFDRLNDLNNNRFTETELYEVANYIYYERGRFIGIDDYKPHHKEAVLFNYNTDKDLKYLGFKCISKEWAGNETVGYAIHLLEPIQDIEEETEKQLYNNNHFEAIIETLIKECDDTSLVLLKEHINEIKKIFFPNISGASPFCFRT